MMSPAVSCAPFSKGRAAASSALAILGILAVLALMGSHDGESAMGTVKESTVVGSTEPMLIMTSTMGEDASSTKLVRNVDDDAAWEKLEDKSDATLQDAKQEDDAAAEEVDQQEEKKESEADAESDAAVAKHSEHHALRDQAAETVGAKVTKTVEDLETGAAASTSQAAAQAAHDVIAKANADKEAKEAMQQKALNQAAKISSLVDRIRAAKTKLAKIQKQRNAFREDSKKAAADFAEKITEQVAMAKDRFTKTHALLSTLRQTNATLATENSQYKSTHEAQLALEEQVSELQDKVDATEKEYTKEVGQKDREHKAFKDKEKKITDKMQMLITKMKKAIKVTAIQKATPHADAQALLKDLNQKSQENSVLIAELSSSVKTLKDNIQESKATEASLAEKKVHRKALLAKAKATKMRLQEAVARYTTAIQRKDTTTEVKSVAPKGTEFAGKLYKKLIDKVKSGLDEGVAKAGHKFRKHLGDHAAEVTSDSAHQGD